MVQKIPVCADVVIRDTDESFDIESKISVSEETYGSICRLAGDVLINLSEPLVEGDICNLEQCEMDSFSDLEILEKIREEALKSHPDCELEIKNYTIPVIFFQK